MDEFHNEPIYTSVPHISVGVGQAVGVCVCLGLPLHWVSSRIPTRLSKYLAMDLSLPPCHEKSP